MLEARKMWRRFRQFGGWRLAKAYVRMGLLWPVTKATVSCAVRRRSLKTAYPVILRTVEPMLLQRYMPVAEAALSALSESGAKPQPATGRTRLWWCWLQGYDKAPALAQACLRSLDRLDGVEVVTIDEDNFGKYVTIDPAITEKYFAGKIPPAMFSDILRLSLLVEHGGVWMDSTIACLGEVTGTPYCPSWSEITASDVFFFQYTKPGLPWSGNVGNWFISAQAGNPLLKAVLEVLKAYWRDHDMALDYYIMHLFVKAVSKAHPNLVAGMPYGYAPAALQLMGHLSDDSDESALRRIASISPLQKLSYRLNRAAYDNQHSAYNLLLNRL